MKKFRHSYIRQEGFTPLQTIDRQRRDMVSVTGFTPLQTIGRQRRDMVSVTGFTLIEIIFTTAIMVVLLVGAISLFIYGFDLQETSKNTTLALNAGRERLEEIRNAAIRNQYDFANLTATCNTNNTLSSPPGAVMKTQVTYAKDTGGQDNPNLINLRVVVCWKQKGGRIIGNMSGPGEGSYCNDSPVEQLSSISKR